MIVFHEFEEGSQKRRKRVIERRQVELTNQRITDLEFAWFLAR
jgi:hypothetical protein